MEEHEQLVRMVLQRLYKNDITVNPDKCQFAVEEVKYLVFMISGEGIKPLPRKVVSICEYPRPQDMYALIGLLPENDERLSENYSLPGVSYAGLEKEGQIGLEPGTTTSFR